MPKERVELEEGHGPYEQPSYSSNTEYSLQIFQDTDTGKYTFLISEEQNNYIHQNDGLKPLAHNTAPVVEGLLKNFEISGVADVDVIFHQPENVSGNNPESFARVNYYFDGNGLHEDYRNPREPLTAEQVAEAIGPENFTEKQFAKEPTFEQNIQQEQEPERPHNLSQEYSADNDASRQVLREDIVGEYLNNLQQEM